MRKDQCIIWYHSKLSGPELTRRDIRGMQLDLTRFFNKSRSGLQRLHIWTMPNLGLRIAPYDLILPSGYDKLLALLLSAHNLNTLDEHT